MASTRLRRTGDGDRWPGVALGVLVVAALITIVVLGDHLSFFNDDWYFLFQRPGKEAHAGADVFLAPHNGNFVLLPVVLYKLLVAVFGLATQFPFRLFLGALVGMVGLCVYKLVADRAGVAAGLAAAAVVLFMGAAWEDLLFFASIDLVGSLATGLAAFVALREDSRRRNSAACALLVISVCCSNVGVAFCVGAICCVFVRRRPRQLWIAIVPLCVFGIWWLAYGGQEPSYVSLSNVGHLPRYVLESVETSMASVTGLNAGTVPATYQRGRIPLIVLLIAVAVWVGRGGRPRTAALAPLSALAAFWILTGIGYTPGREPFASRYQLIDVALLLVVAAEIVPRLRPRLAGSTALVAVGLAVVTANVTTRLETGYRFMRAQSEFVKVDIGVLQAVRSRIPPGLVLTESVAHNPYLTGITGARYVAETTAHGVPPSLSIARLSDASEALRESADGVLAAATGVRAVLIARQRLVSCAHVGNQTDDTARETPVTAGSLILSNRSSSPIGVGLRRFASAGHMSPVALISAGGTDRMTIPPDQLPHDWHLAPILPNAQVHASLLVCRRQL